MRYSIYYILWYGMFDIIAWKFVNKMYDEIRLFHKKKMIDRNGKSFMKLKDTYTLNKREKSLIATWFVDCHKNYGHTCTAYKTCKLILIKLDLLQEIKRIFTIATDIEVINFETV